MQKYEDEDGGGDSEIVRPVRPMEIAKQNIIGEHENAKCLRRPNRLDFFKLDLLRRCVRVVDLRARARVCVCVFAGCLGESLPQHWSDSIKMWR